VYANAICERFLGSVRRECLDHVVILSEQHLLAVLREYVVYFNECRPHQALRQRLPVGAANENTAGKGSVIARPVLGGLHHDYRRVA
jgi:putative transposase